MSALPFIGADELRARTPVEPEWTWTGYLAPGAVTLLAGKPKAGKSTLALALAEAVATGALSFLGRAIKGGPVVYVAEESAPTLAHKTAATGALRVLTRDAVWQKPSWPDLIAGSVEEAQRVGAVALVVDTVPFWASLPRDAEKDAGAAQAMMQPLLDAARTGRAVLGTGHQRKSGGEDGEAVRGSSAITGAADIVLELERGQRPTERVLLALSRYPSTPGSLVIERDPQTGSWRAMAEGERGDRGEIGWAERILSAIPASGDGTTLDELAEVLDADKRKWHAALSKLITDGSITRTGPGTRSDPYRHLRVSVPSFRLEGTDGKDGKTAAEIPSFRPIGRTESTAVDESDPSSTDGFDLDYLESLAHGDRPPKVTVLAADTPDDPGDPSPQDDDALEALAATEMAAERKRKGEPDVLELGAV